jgi:hypothetical protein
MPGRPAGHPPSIRTFPSSTDFECQPQACWRKPTRPVMNQRALELAGLPQRLSEPKRFTAEGAETAKGNQTSPNPSHRTVQNLPDPLLDFGSPDLEMSGGSLRPLRSSRIFWAEHPAQPLWASAEPTWASAGYCAPNRFPRRGRNSGTASPQRFLRARDGEAHTVFEFAN